jgi:hypothetical protein
VYYFNKLRNSFAWILIRYQKSYGLLGSFLSAFNFAGILTLLVQPYFDIPTYIILPFVMVFGVVSILLVGIFLYDKINFQTIMHEKDGALNQYWYKKLTPLQQKNLLMTLDAIENKERIPELRKQVEKGVLL